MQNHYKIFRVTNKSEWEQLFARVPFPHMTQSWAFGEAKRATNWHPWRFVIKSDDNEAIAIGQALNKTIAGIPIATRMNLGPMMLSGHADKEINVYRAIRNHWRIFSLHGILLIHPAVAYGDEAVTELKTMGFHIRNQFKWTSSRIDLTQNEIDLRKSLTSKWRNQLKKSEQQSLQFVAGNTLDDKEWIIQRHIENTSEKNFEGPSPKLLEALYKASPSDFNVFRVVNNRDSIAGMVAFRFGEVAYYYIGWNSVAGRGLNAGNFLLWNACLELKRMGCKKFDLGGHGLHESSGFGGFKLGMNGAGYQLAGEFYCL